MDIGPVELIVLEFPGRRADAGVIRALNELVGRGDVTVLDLVWVTHDDAGELTTADFDESLDGSGLELLDVSGQGLISILSDEDLDLVREELPADRSALVLLYEQTWARTVAAAVRAAGGEVELHLQLPHDLVIETVNALTSGAS